MALLHIHCSISIPPISSLNPKPNNSLPARDRVIDFGKHKGRMLGSLPSKYLIWVSKNLRARDFQHWAELADEVLSDPVYKDRIEWESAERVLSGNGSNTLRSSPNSSSAVPALMEISEGFGWDNGDKDGWARVDFGLLGTSRGGRIPRVTGTSTRSEAKGEASEASGKREGRRGRRRAKRGDQMEGLSWDVGLDIGVETSPSRRRSGDVGLDIGVETSSSRRRSGDVCVDFVNPFPGRGALLDKVRTREQRD